ncbi:MAG: hypothetical protein FIA92_07820 [Chloroflexi bacterium]|nr:hypothetical protein [Chloroflexota bacterium]
MPTARTLGLGLVILGLGIGALVPIFMVVYPAAGITPSDASNPAVVLPVIAANPLLVTGPGALEIGVHVIGAVVLVGFWARFGPTSFLMAVATLGGLLWLSVDVIDNAITYHAVPGLAADYVGGTTAAGPAFVQLTSVVEAVRLGAHVVGGLWVVGLSIFAIRTRTLPAVVGWLGIAVGAVFAANLFVPALLNISFLTMPTWLVILGASVARAQVASVPAMLPRIAEA